MASPDIYSRIRGREFTDTKNPLDKSVGDFEQDEPVRPTQRPWGWFPFLYESPGALDIGSAGIEWPDLGGYPVPSIDLWQFPNAEQFAQVQPTPAVPTEDPTNIQNVCTEESMKTETMHTFCMNLGSLDGCFLLKTVLPGTTGFKQADGSTSIVGVDTTMPNGNKLSFREVTVFGGCASNPTYPFPAIRGEVTTPGGTIVTACQRGHRQGGGSLLGCTHPDPLAKNTVAEAVDAVLECLQSAYGSGYAGLGC